MNMICARTQYAVGQGFFHAAHVNSSLHYVVDCGAMNRYKVARQARVSAYIKQMNKQKIDFLFVSHVHADHVNGIPQLLDSTSGLKVETIVMPLMNVKDRLIAFARAAALDEAAATSAFFRDFIVDPVVALARFNPTRILVVEPGAGDTGAPFRGGADDNNNQPPLGWEADRELSWKLVGQGGVRSKLRKGKGKDVQVMEMPDSIGIVVSGGAGTPDWLLAPYVDPSVSAASSKFMTRLAAELKISLPKLKKRVADTAQLKAMVIDDICALKKAYEEINTDLNVTSLCLYSGPIPDHGSHIHVVDAGLDGGAMMGWISDRSAWLGTGDAALASQQRRGNFFFHYGNLIDGVVTFTLPHHGSEHNFHKALLAHIKPSICVAAADAFSNWHHPATSVMQQVGSAGALMATVTSSLPSELSETVYVLKV